MYKMVKISLSIGIYLFCYVPTHTYYFYQIYKREGKIMFKFGKGSAYLNCHLCYSVLVTDDKT